MARPAAFTINNYISKSCNDNDVIELDEDEQTVRFNKIRHGKVSPSPFRNNYVHHPTSRSTVRRRWPNLLVLIFSTLSMITFILVCALLVGLIEPRNMRTSSGCRCAHGAPPGNIQTRALKNDDDFVSKKQLEDSLEKSMEKTLAFARQEIQRQMANFSTAIHNRVTVLDKIRQLENNTKQNTTKILESVSDLNIAVEKFMNSTRKEISEMRTSSKLTLQRLQKLTLQNVTTLAKSFNELTLYHEKFDDFKEELLRNVTKSNEMITLVSTSVEKFMNETELKLSEEHNNTISSLKKNEQDISKMNTSLWVKLSTLRGPRGYNGTDGRAGPPGPQGPQGIRGPRGYLMKCENETHLTKSARYVPTYFNTIRNSTTQLFFDMSCEASKDGKDISRATGSSFKCQCTYKWMRPYSCTLKYTLCNLLAVP